MEVGRIWAGAIAFFSDHFPPPVLDLSARCNASALSVLFVIAADHCHAWRTAFAHELAAKYDVTALRTACRSLAIIQELLGCPALQ
eukprot:1950318-Amphidinium_carterae.1